MAACTMFTSVADTGNTPNSTGSFTPTKGDLLVVFVVASATITTGDSLVDSDGSVTFTQVNTAVYATSVNVIYAYVANNLVPVSGITRTLTFNNASDTASGTCIFVFTVTGMTKSGLAAIRQSAKTENGSAGGTPAATFSANALASNPTLGCVGNNSSPAGVTPPASWTEQASTGDIGYASPTTGGEVVSRDTGFSSTTITWGSTSATVYGVLIIELDCDKHPIRLPQIQPVLAQ